jgi:hypothetical protein
MLHVIKTKSGSYHILNNSKPFTKKIILAKVDNVYYFVKPTSDSIYEINLDSLKKEGSIQKISEKPSSEQFKELRNWLFRIENDLRNVSFLDYEGFVNVMQQFGDLAQNAGYALEGFEKDVFRAMISNAYRNKFLSYVFNFIKKHPEKERQIKSLVKQLEF